MWCVLLYIAPTLSYLLAIGFAWDSRVNKCRNSSSDDSSRVAFWFPGLGLDKGAFASYIESALTIYSSLKARKLGFFIQIQPGTFFQNSLSSTDFHVTLEGPFLNGNHCLVWLIEDAKNRLFYFSLLAVKKKASNRFRKLRLDPFPFVWSKDWASACSKGGQSIELLRWERKDSAFVLRSSVAYSYPYEKER